MKLKSCWKYFKLYLKQIFDIGNSTGSLFLVIITLFRTFQRISAPPEFITKFSPECAKMFRWATKFITIIANTVQTTPFVNFELFSIYAFVFPLTILTFISTTVYGFIFLLVFFIILGGCLICYGVGLYSDEDERKVSIFFFVVGSLLILAIGLGLLYIKIGNICKCLKKNNSINEDALAEVLNENEISEMFSENENENNYEYKKKKSKSLGKYRFVFSFSCTALVFYGLMIPFMEKRWRLTIMISIVISVLTVIIIVVEFIFRLIKSFKIFYFQKRVSGFLVNCLSLFVIPSAEIFFELIEEKKYKNDWHIKAAYIYNSLTIPLCLITAMIILNHPNVEEKYKKIESCKFNFYYVYEFIDMASQIAYAICAAKDLLMACIGIEIFVVVLIIVFRPFSSVSEHILSCGNAAVLITSNGVLYHFHLHKYEYLSFRWSVFLLVLACTPAVLSFYLFFFFDFEIKPEDSDDIGEENNGKVIVCDSVMKLCKVATFLSPIAWFCLSLNLPNIGRKFNFNE